MFRYFAVLFLSLAVVSCSIADGKNNSCSEIPLNQLLSNYVVFHVARFGGGLTTETLAKKRIGEVVSIKQNSFKIRGFAISNPIYQLSCYSFPREGEVDTNRWSNFYGFGLNRKSINVLEVYDKSDAAGEPSIKFEILDSELWELYDGWLYKMKVVKD